MLFRPNRRIQFRKYSIIGDAILIVLVSDRFTAGTGSRHHARSACMHVARTVMYVIFQKLCYCTIECINIIRCTDNHTTATRTMARTGTRRELVANQYCCSRRKQFQKYSSIGYPVLRISYDAHELYSFNFDVHCFVI
jgi:hypothetical protein